MKERPDRLREVNEEVERMGCRVVSQYAVLGPFDFITIIDAPDEVTVSRLSVNLGARGTVRIQTLSAIPIDKFIEGLKG